MPRNYEKREATAYRFGGPSERNDADPSSLNSELYRTLPPEDTGVAAADMAAVGCAIGYRRPTRVGDITVRGAGRHLQWQ